MTDFETALDPRFTMYAGDIAADQKAVEGVPAAIDQAVDRLKELLLRNAFDSNAGMYHALHRIGQLLDMRKRLTGEHKNAEYLLFDDGESSLYLHSSIRRLPEGLSYGAEPAAQAGKGKGFPVNWGKASSEGRISQQLGENPANGGAEALAAPWAVRAQA